MKLSTSSIHGISVIAISGSVDFYTSAGLRRAVSAVMAEGSEHIVFDLSEVEHIDRSGIAVLVGTATQQRYAKRQVSLVGATGPVEAALARDDADLPSFAALEHLQQFAA